LHNRRSQFASHLTKNLVGVVLGQMPVQESMDATSDALFEGPRPNQ